MQIDRETVKNSLILCNVRKVSCEYPKVKYKSKIFFDLMCFISRNFDIVKELDNFINLQDSFFILTALLQAVLI